MQRLLSTLILLFALPIAAGSVSRTENGFRFTEAFRWQGIHAASLGPADAHGIGTTVFWDADSWDVRNDTTVAALKGGRGSHTAIHRTFSADPKDARIANRELVGGDGSPGIGLMEIDHQGIVSARLRNPLLLSATQSGVVSFRAPRFVTTGHWWEVAITPATTVVGAEHTGVPSTTDPLSSPLTTTVAGTTGPGHRPAEDSINVVAAGYPDNPCPEEPGWHLETAVIRTTARLSTSVVNQRENLADLIATTPNEGLKLYRWRIEYRPDRIDLFADFEEDGTLDFIDRFDVTIPWSEVYVHLMGAAYDAAHHPPQPCELGTTREIAWRDVVVEPVKYAATLATPKETARESGWLGYDLRDTQHFGTGGVTAAPPNRAPYDFLQSVAWCSGGTIYCHQPVDRIELTFTIPPSSRPARAQFLHDIRSYGIPGSATLFVNGVAVGVLPAASTVPAAAVDEWVRRSIGFDPALLVTGENRVQIAFAGGVQLDRMEIEIDYGAVPPRRRAVR